MATQKRAISTAISIINGIVILIPSALILGKFFGITGVWYSLVVAQVGTLVVVYFIDLAEKRKSGGKYKNFYLDMFRAKGILELMKGYLALSFKGTKENAAGVSLYLSSFLSKNGIEESRANRIAVAVEEMAANCAERMKGKKKFADIDIRIFADKNETIISVRDNGDEFDPLNDDKEFEMSPLTVVKAISDKVEYSRVLGFNRTIIKL